MTHDIKSIRQRLIDDLPLQLSGEECRWLLELATGERIPERKRCEACHGTGKYYRYGNSPADPCLDCHGSGYQKEPIDET